MKKNLLSMMAAGITAILILGSTNAQVAMRTSNVGEDLPISNNDQNKTGVRVDVGLLTFKNFKKQFPTTTDAVWYETDKVYVAKFTANSIATMVAYGKRGTWVYTIRRYDEKSLPKEIRALVKSIYYDYTIVRIDEVNIPQRENSIYILHLRDRKNLKTVRVCDDEMEVIADFNE